jgi:ABC-type Fe3+ transport system permease subunit
MEAARGLGASPLRVARTILLPLLAPALVGIFALTWALCASELSVSVMTQQPGGQPLTLPVFQLMHIFAMDKVAALCLLLVAMSGVVMGLAALLARKFFNTRP